MYPRRRYYGGGGGCLGGLLSMIFTPIIVVLFILFFLIAMFDNGIEVEVTDSYSEETFQDYTNRQYEKEFGSSSAYEDNLLITVLVEDESYYDFYYIAWVGDHIVTDINHMLGNNDTELGYAMNDCISATSYKYSLDSNLAQVIYEMTDAVTALGLDSSFTCEENHAQVTSHLSNHTGLDLTESTVNEALAAFTDATGIPIVIVVEDIDDVFSTRTTYPGVTSSQTSSRSSTWLWIVAGAAIFLIVLSAGKNKKVKWDGVPENESQDYRYTEFDDQA